MGEKAPGGDWTSFIFDNNNSRYQASSTITSGNVASLKEAWFFPANHSVTSTPIVQNGHVYFADWGGNVYSLAISTGSDDGARDWERNVGFAISSTPAVANGLVYVAGSPLKPSRVVALNQTNDEVVWNTTIRTTSGGIYSSPIIYNGLLYIGISDCKEVLPGCSEHASSLIGEIDALNATNGKPIWRFQTGNDSTNGGFGGGVWGSVVVDPLLNSIYFGTGNTFVSTPSSCATCSLYAYSIISLNASSGKLNWYNQVYRNHQTGFDLDFGSTPNLFSLVKSHVTYQALGLGNKNGLYYILDRTNGKLLAKLSTGGSAGEGVTGVAGFVYTSGAAINPKIFIPVSVGSAGRVEAWDSSTDTMLWKFSTSGQVPGSVAEVPGAVLFGDTSGTLYALSSSKGTSLFNQKLPGIPSGYGIYGGVTVAEGFVLVGDFNGESSGKNSGGLYAFSPPSTTTSTTSSSSSTGTSSSSSPVPFGIDGSSSTQRSSISSLSVTLSTAHSPDLVIVYAFTASTGATISVSDTASLHWDVRESYIFTGYGKLYEFYATSLTKLSSDTIKVTQTKLDTLNVIAFGISGADITSPFDPNSALPQVATGSSTMPSVKVSTTSPSDMILGFLAVSGNPSKTPSSGFNLIKSTSISPSASTEYEIVTSGEANLPVGYSFGTIGHWAIIGDAIAIATADTSGASGPSVFLSSFETSFQNPGIGLAALILAPLVALIGAGLRKLALSFLRKQNEAIHKWSRF